MASPSPIDRTFPPTQWGLCKPNSLGAADEPITPPVLDVDGSRRRSSPVLPRSSPYPGQPREGGGSRPFILSPPPTPRGHRPRQSGIKHRIRSNSGLSFNTSEEALRRYTDYNPDGTPRSPVFASVSWKGDASFPMVARGGGQDEHSPTLPIPDFFSRHVFQMVLKDPVTMDRLLRFAESQRADEDIDFLIKVQGYNRLMEETVAHMATISASFTAVGASTPIKLPSYIAKTLDNETKQAATKSIPKLQTMFQDSRAFVEQRVYTTIYRDFIKRQLSICASIALPSAGSMDLSYPGLGDSFCITNPFDTNNPIMWASDGFASLTGYEWSDFFSRNCTFLQGANTSREAIMRIRDAMLRREELVELVLNYTKSGQPFWNLLYICPLLGTTGRLCYYLGAQVNVSEAIESDKDILNILSCRSAFALPERRHRPSTTRDSSSSGERDLSFISSETSARTRAGLSMSFFNPFRRTGNSVSMANSRQVSQPASDAGLEPASRGRSANRRYSIPVQLETFQSTYSRFMVLRNTQSNNILQLPGPTPGDSSRGGKSNNKTSLTVSFCTRSALDILGLSMTAEAMNNRDIFKVLAEKANSPSVNKQFRTAVRETVIKGSETLRLELAVGRGLVAEGGSKKKGDWSRRSSLVESLVSHWTPMKDAAGNVEWVILVLSPLMGA